ncbi:hypothetical protein BRC95_05995 [Halobacteriales archaeon QS_5_68_33]|nr:MAG: hypothetical protein BRC95_05995 [Halobacteriales archaeon QS_5_68_33]
MDLNELQSVQSRERQTDSLQQLRATFYRDAADYIADLESERDAAAERADDPWNAPEVGRLNDDIDTGKDTVEAIYERRVGKIVKMASLAAADMPTGDEGLTEEEQALFDRLVSAIEQNREGVFAILDGEDPPVDPTDHGAADREPDAQTPTAGPTDGVEAAGRGSRDTGDGGTVDAADLMADGPDDSRSDAGPDPAGPDPARTDTVGSGPAGTDSAGGAGPASVDRSMVRITDDVGPIYGVEGREYELTENDVVTLPEPNVGPLLEKDAAERID